MSSVRVGGENVKALREPSRCIWINLNSVAGSKFAATPAGNQAVGSFAFPLDDDDVVAPK